MILPTSDDELLRVVPENWLLLTSRLAARGEAVSHADIEERGQGPISEGLSGMAYDDVADLLDAAEPYDAAAANWSLTPEERLAAVQRAQAMGTQSTP